MELKKTESAMVRGKTIDQHPQIKTEHPERSSYAASLSILFQSKQRVPEILQSTLRAKVSETKSNKEQQEQANVRTSKIGGMIKSKLKSVLHTEKTICEICEAEIEKPKDKNRQVYVCNCEHKDKFCQSCLHHYVIYKVKSFEEVLCPHDGCPQILDTTARFFKNLPTDIQKNYKKLHQFYLTSKDPDLRLCPRQDCEGIIKASSPTVMLCNECKGEFCSKCLLAVHEGECDTQEVKFFESNLHYRQCKKCKFIIEKNQGCNHMTCRCRYQFCYVCGEKWSPKHYGEHDENGNVVEGQANPYNENECCDCGCCQCCDLEQTCGAPCAFIIKSPIKLILFILLFAMMAMIWVSRDLFVLIGLVFVCIFAGMFGYPCIIISEQEGIWCFLAVLFLPITMIIGIGVAFKQIFCDVVPEMQGEFCEMFCEAANGICDL